MSEQVTSPNTGVTGGYCIECEKDCNWIRIALADEKGQAFNEIPGILIDGTGVKHPIVAGKKPIFLDKIAPGNVTLRFEPKAWLKDTQNRRYNSSEKPFEAQLIDELCLPERKNYDQYFATAVAGDFIEPSEALKLPTRHQKSKENYLKLYHNQTHLIRIQGFNWLKLRFGVFFDGTANNTYSAKWGKQQLDRYSSDWVSSYGSLGYEVTDYKPGFFNYPTDKNGKEKVEGSAANEPTNVQKLFDLYKKDSLIEANTLCLAEYVTGVGTSNSTEIAKADESTLTQGLGIEQMTFGEYGIIEKAEKTAPKQIAKRLTEMVNTAAYTNLRLDHDIDGIESIQWDIFGFSRGAAAARHFIHFILENPYEIHKMTSQDLATNGPWRQQLAKNSPLGNLMIKSLKQNNLTLKANFDWQDNQDHCVEFVGLWDTVAAVADVVNWDLSASNAMNDPVKLWLDPKRVKRAVHLTADPTTEYRKNFSLNQLNPADHFTEVALPGTHSDIGGGYHSLRAFSHLRHIADRFKLPELENKLVGQIDIDRINIPLFNGSKKMDHQIQSAKKQLIETQQKRLSLDPQDYGNFIQGYHFELSQTQGRDYSSYRIKLYLSRQVNGQLSRLYLRMMFGLAEFYQVPVDENLLGYNAWSEFPRNKKEPDYYLVSDTIGKTSFADLAATVLEEARQGKVDAKRVQQLKPQLLDDLLLHNSSDTGWVNSPNYSKIGDTQCYYRQIHPCYPPAKEKL